MTQLSAIMTIPRVRKPSIEGSMSGLATAATIIGEIMRLIEDFYYYRGADGSRKGGAKVSKNKFCNQG